MHNVTVWYNSKIHNLVTGNQSLPTSEAVRELGGVVDNQLIVLFISHSLQGHPSGYYLNSSSSFVQEWHFLNRLRVFETGC